MRVSELIGLLNRESPFKVVRIDTGDDSIGITGIEDAGCCILITPHYSFDDDDEQDDDDDGDEDDAAGEDVTAVVEMSLEDEVNLRIKELKASADVAIKAFAEFGVVASNLLETVINKKDRTS